MSRTFRTAQTVASVAQASRSHHSWGTRITSIPRMLRAAYTRSWADAPVGKLTLSVLGLVYVLSPLDFLPEMLLGPFGLGDDLAIAAVATAYLLTQVDRWLDDEPATDTTAGDVVEGVVLNREDTPPSH